jgi:hypothetical protein
MELHKSLTPKRIARAVERGYRTLECPGFCTACGKKAEGIEGDARGYTCEFCERKTVYGAEELLLMVAEEEEARCPTQ